MHLPSSPVRILARVFNAASPTAALPPSVLPSLVLPDIYTNSTARPSLDSVRPSYLHVVRANSPSYQEQRPLQIVKCWELPEGAQESESSLVSSSLSLWVDSESQREARRKLVKYWSPPVSEPIQSTPATWQRWTLQGRILKPKAGASLSFSWEIYVFAVTRN